MKEDSVINTMEYSVKAVNCAFAIIQIINDAKLKESAVYNKIKKCSIAMKEITKDCVDNIVYNADELPENKYIIDAIKETLLVIIEVKQTIKIIIDEVNDENISQDFANFYYINMTLLSSINYLYNINSEQQKALKLAYNNIITYIDIIRKTYAEIAKRKYKKNIKPYDYVEPDKKESKPNTKIKTFSFVKEKECNSVKFNKGEPKIGQYLFAVNTPNRLGCGQEEYPKYEGDGKYCCSKTKATDQETLDYVNNSIVDMISYSDPDISPNARTKFNSNMKYLNIKRNELLKSGTLIDHLAIPGFYFNDTLDQWHRWIFLLNIQGIDPWINDYSTLRNIKNNETGETLLMFAVKNQYPAVVKFLIETAKVDINAKDGKNKTALDYANELPESETKTIIKNMIDPNLNNDDYEDAFSNPPPSISRNNNNKSSLKLNAGKRKSKKRSTRKKRKTRRRKNRRS